MPHLFWEPVLATGRFRPFAIRSNGRCEPVAEKGRTPAGFSSRVGFRGHESMTWPVSIGYDPPRKSGPDTGRVILCSDLLPPYLSSSL